ncbi:MAG TPA: NADH-quinone oxidoreductase subunit J, partial [Methylotenera sp.]|nr:NADH-quinone oxidoreductase subunit J [Methylotenera sp.]
RGRRESKSMDPAKQVLVKKSDRLRIVKMDATVEQAAENNDGSVKEDK